MDDTNTAPLIQMMNNRCSSECKYCQPSCINTPVWLLFPHQIMEHTRAMSVSSSSTQTCWLLVLVVVTCGSLLSLCIHSKAIWEEIPVFHLQWCKWFSFWALQYWVDCNIEHTQPSSMTIKPGESLAINCKVTGASITDSSYWGTAWIR